MRLINADELTPTITQWNPSALIEESYYHEEQIINAPTVDAIPVKWIKEWVDKYAGYTGYTSYLLSIVEMLDDWRKENESETIS